jgi:hypothetical protein
MKKTKVDMSAESAEDAEPSIEEKTKFAHDIYRVKSEVRPMHPAISALLLSPFRRSWALLS